jgi:hypothetical protein
MNKTTFQDKTREQPGKSMQDTSDYWKRHPKISVAILISVEILFCSFFLYYIWRDLLGFIKQEYVLILWFFATIGLSSLLFRGEKKKSIWTDELWMTSADELLLTYSFNLVCQTFLALALLWLLLSSDPLRVFRTPFAELTLGMLLLGLLKIVGLAVLALLLFFSIFICVESTREYRPWMQKKGIRWRTPLVLFLCSLSNAALVDIVIFRLGRFVLAALSRKFS